jgi:uncharacterized FAD-dependent dehydrogenase
MVIDAGYYRLKCILGNGHKFYISKQGMIHLVNGETARMWLAATDEKHPMCLLVTPFVVGVRYEVKRGCQDGKAVDAGVFRQG